MARQAISMDKYHQVAEYHAMLQDQFSKGFLDGKITVKIDAFCESIGVSPSWYWHKRKDAI